MSRKGAIFLFLTILIITGLKVVPIHSETGDLIIKISNPQEIFSESFTAPADFYRVLTEFTMNKPVLEIQLESENSIELYLMNDREYAKCSANNFTIIFSSYFWVDWTQGITKIDEVFLLEPINWHLVLINRNPNPTDVSVTINKGNIISKQETSIEISIFNQNIQPNEEINVNGTLSPKVANKEITVNLRDPDYNLINFTLMTDENGLFQFNYLPNKTGVWSFNASFKGDDIYNSTTSKRLYFGVGVTASERIIEIEISDTNIIIDESIVIKGKVSIPGIWTIEMKNSQKYQETPYLIIQTYENGTFYQEWNPSYPKEYQIRFQLNATEEYDELNSEVFSINVEKIPVDIDITLSTEITRPEDVLVVSGEIYPKEGFKEMPFINIVFINPDGDDLPQVCRVSENGTFSLDYSFFNDWPGVWTININWSGDETHSPIETHELTFEHKISETEPEPENEPNPIPGYSLLSVTCSLIIYILLLKKRYNHS